MGSPRRWRCHGHIPVDALLGEAQRLLIAGKVLMDPELPTACATRLNFPLD
jgi:hypothetical protein